MHKALLFWNTSVLVALCLLGAEIATAQATLRAADGNSLPLATLDPDPSVPTIRQVLGYDWASEITTHASLKRYLESLAQAAPDRTRLVRYGQSYEKRELYYLVITSPRNLERLDQIRKTNIKLSDPRRTTLPQAGRMIRDMPAIVWLAASVHGNELSSTEAALLTAYHLLADRSEENTRLLEQLVVLIDPLQNPDGRARYVNVYRESRGAFVDSHPLSTEHTERWPGGRFNHYLFDMNRDWFLQSQQETVHKVRAYLHWQPQIYVDAHEMGRNSSYFFVPPMDPLNPFMLPRQTQWMFELGKHQSAWFDRYGFAYTTREIFDAFFPGYGSEWPTLQGGLGILWEQAGTRGLMVDRDDETKLLYQDAVCHHYISSLATLQIAGQRREELLGDFYDARSRGVQLGHEGDTKHFFLPLEPRPNRSIRLAQLLRRNGIDVFVVDQPLTVTATDMRSGEKSEQVIRTGTLHIPVAQPAGRLVRVLLDRQVAMDEEYVKRQLQRKEDYLPDQIYDVTAWSLPLAFDVPCLMTDSDAPQTRRWDGRPPAAEGELSEAQVAYLVRPTDGALEALCSWLQRGVRVHVTSQPFTLGQQKFPAGTLILKRPENGENLHQRVTQAVRKFQLDATATDTGFVTEGAHFGGPHVKWVRPPKLALVVDRPTSYSVGHTWHLFDQRLRYPSTRVSCHNLPRLDLNKFNVLILPDGSYADSNQMGQGFAQRLKQWVREGGTLILVAGAATWAASEKIGLMPLERVAQPRDPSPPDAAAPTNAVDEKQPAPRWPDSVPGAFLQATVFDQHWLSFGCPNTLHLFFRGNVFFQPPKPEQGRSLVQFVGEDDVLTSGFCWPETKQLIAGKTYLAYFSLGQGHVIAFAADPNYRAMYPSLQRLFINACLLGPGQ